MKKISRSGFLKLAAAAAMSGVTAGALTACGNSASSSSAAASSAAVYTPGTYTAKATGMGEVTVSMTFTENAITDVTVDTANETIDLARNSAEDFQKALLDAQSAEIDGAGPMRKFVSITLPYMFFVTAPATITTFVTNFNNFNVIYLLTAGGPFSLDYYQAGKTDLLVTWLYKLTVDYQYYNIGAVIGILTFVVLSIVALVTYRNTKAYKDEEGFM